MELLPVQVLLICMTLWLFRWCYMMSIWVKDLQLAKKVAAAFVGYGVLFVFGLPLLFFGDLIEAEFAKDDTHWAFVVPTLMFVYLVFDFSFSIGIRTVGGWDANNKRGLQRATYWGLGVSVVFCVLVSIGLFFTR